MLHRNKDHQKQQQRDQATYVFHFGIDSEN